MSHFLRKSLSSFLYRPTLFCCRHFSHSHPHNTTSLFSPTWLSRNSYTNGLSPTRARFWASQPAVTEPSTSDGLTVEGIISNNWTILDENDGDWKSHAAAIAQSITLIKRRLQWKKLKVRLNMLSVQLNKEDLWDDPVRAGKINREHGSLLGKMKEVNGLERELLEHIEMIKLAREENHEELELVGTSFII